MINAKTPASVRTVDIHDDLLDELSAYKQALGEGCRRRIQRSRTTAAAARTDTRRRAT